MLGARQALFQLFGPRHDHIIPRCRFKRIPLGWKRWRSNRTVRMCSDPGMANSDPLPPDSAQFLEALVADAKTTARDQLHAASQLQLDRLHEQLTAQWHTDLEHIFDERLAEAVARIEAWHQNDSGSRVATVAANARANARRDLSEQLGQTVRRLRQFESEEQWGQILLDATRGFCDRAALFVVNGPSLELRAVRG